MRPIDDIMKLYALLGFETPERNETDFLNNPILVSLPFTLSPPLFAFYTSVDGWDGFLKNQYFRLYSLEEAHERTLEVGSLDFKSSLFAIGDNGASEVFFIDKNNHIFVGDEIGLPDSLLKVSNSFLELLEYPEKVDDAFG